jgi:hypothetical protein
LARFAPRQKIKNEAGMSMIINDFYFWNLAKAGMFMKTSELSEKAGMSLINKSVTNYRESGIVLCYLKQ